MKMLINPKEWISYAGILHKWQEVGRTIFDKRSYSFSLFIAQRQFSLTLFFNFGQDQRIK